MLDQLHPHAYTHARARTTVYTLTACILSISQGTKAKGRQHMAEQEDRQGEHQVQDAGTSAQDHVASTEDDEHPPHPSEADSDIGLL